MSTHKYAILSIPRRSHCAALMREPSGFDEFHLLDKGISVAAVYPKDAEMLMDRDHKGMKLDDFVYNGFRWLIVSEKAKAVLEKEPIQIEWLPLAIVDKKQKRVDRPYCLAQILGLVDCLDLERSEYEFSAGSSDEILFLDRIFLDEKRIPKDATLFRLKQQPTTYIVREDLLERLTAAGVTGFERLELGAHVML